jgi:DNA-binding XRE family transcriptional regulator
MKVKRVSRKGMKVVPFTKEQVQELTLAIESKNYVDNISIAIAHAEKFNKSIRNVYQKVIRIISKKASTPVQVAKIEVIEEKLKPLTLPEGMTYQGNAKKVELHADHFRVYF